ncbi:TPA: anion permease, partial [Escherichia coli]|nr:anion permease [Escherichia coli]
AGAPWSLTMSAILYFLARKLLPPETEAVEGGSEAIKKALAELGPTTGKEKRLIGISLLLLLFWSTGGKLHSIDTTSVTLAGLAIMLLPGIGVMSWKEVEKRVQWGTLLMFGIGISLGSTLLDTQAASWMANYVVKGFGLDGLPSLAIFAILAAFLIIIHLGFASATALTAALLPILISLLSSLPPELGVNPVGMTILLAFSVSFGFILPINAPQNMVCMGTDTFTPRQFTRVGLYLTVIGYLLLLLFAATWWKILGLM